jgi:hypothetical protein
MDDLIYSLKQDKFPISKALATKVRKVLDTPIKLLIIPKISIKNWIKLQKTFDSVEEFYLLSSKELSSMFDMKQSEIDKIRYSLTQQNFVQHPLIKESKFLSKKDIEILNQIDIKHYSGLLNNKEKLNEIPRNIRDKIKILQTTNIKKFYPTIESSLNLIDLIYLDMSIDNLSMEKNQRDSFNQAINFIFTKGTTLIQLLDLDQKEQRLDMSDITIEYLLLLRKLDENLFTKTTEKLHSKLSKRFKEILSFLNRSAILLLPDRSGIDLIAKHSYINLEEILLEENNILRNKIPDKTFQRNLRNISLKLLKSLNKELTKLPEELLSSSNITQLKNSSLLSIEEALTFNKQSKTKTSSIWKTTDSLRSAVETELLTLPPIRESKQILREIARLKLITVYDLLLYCKSVPETEDKLNCELLLPKLSVTKVEKLLETEQKRFTSFIKDTETAGYLRKLNIRSLGALIEYMESNQKTAIESELQSVVVALRTPMNLLVEESRLLTKLNESDIYQVKDFILVPDIRKKLNVTLTEKEQLVIRDLQNSLNVNSIKEKLSRESYTVKGIGLFDVDLKNALDESGYSTIAHLTLPQELISSKSRANNMQISRIKKALDAPIYYMSDLIKDKVQLIFALHKENIITLWDVFGIPMQKLSKLCEMPVKQLRTYFSELTTESLKQAEKEQVIIKKTHPFLNDELELGLKEVGITTLQDLLLPTNVQKNSAIYKHAEIKKLLDLLEKPVSQLDFETEVDKQVKQLGIQTIKEFIVYPAVAMEGKVDLSYLSIKSMKNRLNLKKKSSPKKFTTKTKSSTTAKKTTPKPKPKPKPKSPSAKPVTAKSKPSPVPSKTSSSAKTATVKTASSSKQVKSRQTTLLDVSQNTKKPTNTKEDK